MWGDGRLELLPKVAGAAALRLSAHLDKLVAGHVARLVDGEVCVYLGSEFERDALEGWRCRLGGLHDAVFWSLSSEMETGVTKSFPKIWERAWVCICEVMSYVTREGGNADTSEGIVDGAV